MLEILLKSIKLNARIIEVPMILKSDKRVGKSKMKIFNDEMTVTELIDLVTFLQPNYTLVPYQHTKYQYYPIQ